jgi:transmembrane protein 222
MTGVTTIKRRYAYSIVWTTLPFISCLLPFIGHTGICTSDGVIHDFAGPYYVSLDDFAFGKPLKYVRLDNSKITDKEWDEAVIGADKKFGNMMV